MGDRQLRKKSPPGRCIAHGQAAQEDLYLHRTRQQILTKVIEEDLTVLVEGRTGVTWFLGTVEGTVAGTSFAA